jgi:tetratricopeptide (TPR) repeat protein
MKNYLIFGLLLTFAWSINAQKKELRTAGKELDRGNFEKASTVLSAAASFLDAMDEKQKSQYYLYQSILFFKNGSATSAEIDQSVEAFGNVTSAVPTQEKGMHLQKLINHLLTKGSDFASTNDYSSATDYFSNAYKLSQKDTIYLYYAASSAVNAQQYDKSLAMYEQLKSLGFTGIEKQFFAVNKETNEVEPFDSKVLRDVSVKTKTHVNPTEKNTKSKYPEIIKNMALIYNQRGETEKALEAMREARAENPDDLNLVLTEANVHYSMGNTQKFKELLEYATERDPNNAELQYNLGVLAAEANDVANAKKYYQRAIEINPKYTNAYINIAALILGQEESIIDEMNNLGTSAADDRRYDELREERNQLYLDAIPYLEQALVADPTNVQAAKTLSNIFSATGNDAKAKEYKDLANSLEQ